MPAIVHHLPDGRHGPLRHPRRTEALTPNGRSHMARGKKPTPAQVYSREYDTAQEGKFGRTYKTPALAKARQAGRKWGKADAADGYNAKQSLRDLNRYMREERKRK